MKILALEKEVFDVTDDQFTEDILKAEARKAWELDQSGTRRLTPGSTGRFSGACFSWIPESGLRSRTS
jgi:hypothetical protein